MLKSVLRTLAAVLVSTIAYSASALAAERVALVIGNGAYKFATSLPNPTNDATDIGEKLKTLGFEVYGGKDLDRVGMEGAIRQFAENSAGAKVVLFFYAGHGMEVNGKNYLVPIDARLETPTALNFEVVDINVVLNYMVEEKRIAIALLDACRDNPLARSFRKKSRSGTVGNGLGDVKVDQVGGGGLLFGLATAPGDVAADGEGRNSPFSKALLKHMGTPGVEFEQMMKSVKRDVDADTKGDQRPYLTSSLVEDLYLNGEVKQSGGGDSREEEARKAWEAIKDLNAPSVFDSLAEKYPGTAYADFAVKRAAELRQLASRDPVQNVDEREEAARKAWEAIKDLNAPSVFDALAQKYDGTIYAEFALKRAADLRKKVKPAPGPDDGKKVVERSNARWFVVTGSFPKGQRVKANKRLRDTRSAGYEAVMVDSDDYANLADGLLVVVIKATTRDQAKGIEEQVRDSFGDAYVKEAF